MADVVSVSPDGKTITVETHNEEQTTLPVSMTLGYNGDHERDMDDVFQMNDLNEAGLLHLLCRRSTANVMYTEIGGILISVNPYETIPGLYDLKNEEFTKVPHVFRVASKAYDEMLNSGLKGQSQSLLINGESGAGKTEASRRILGFLCDKSQQKRKEISKSMRFIRMGMSQMRNSVRMPSLFLGTVKKQDDDRSVSAIESCILQTSTVLEAFGNSVTIRNDNSSRFGKFIQLVCSQQGVISSAQIQHFLLEKSRVVIHAKGERSYHIFYYLLDAIANQEIPELQFVGDLLKNVDRFEYAVSEPVDTDKNKLNAVIEALEILGVGIEERMEIWRVIGAILSLGNIEFEKFENKAENLMCRVVDDGNLQVTAELFGVDVDELFNSFCRRTVRAGRRASVSLVPLSVDEATSSRNGLAKSLYGYLFDWLVQRINIATGQAVLITSSGSTGKKKVKKELFIGILDIFGFEILECNSFEQLCINYANEKLQGMFDEYVFHLEMDALEDQGVTCPELSFRDNIQLLGLIDGKPDGILRMLDEQGALGSRGSDELFLKGLVSTHDGKNNRFQYNRRQPHYFEILHFAGPVSYAVDGMVSKNSDHLQPDLARVISDHPNACSLVRILLKDGDSEEVPQRRVGRRGTLKSFKQQIEAPQKKMAKLESVSAKFRDQMTRLSDLLQSTNIHFIRCVKPNDDKKPREWDSHMVVSQLKMLGVLEMVRIRQEGFPIRTDFVSFLERYPEMVKCIPDEANSRLLCAAFLNKFLGSKVKGREWQLGEEKCFLLESTQKELDLEERKKREANASAAELLERRRQARQKEKEENSAVTRFAALYRRHAEQKSYASTKNAITAVQSHARRKKLAAMTAEKKTLATKVQALFRGKNTRKQVSLDHSIKVLQAHCRRFLTMRRYEKIQSERNPYQDILDANEIILLVIPDVKLVVKRKLLKRGKIVRTSKHKVLYYDAETLLNHFELNDSCSWMSAPNSTNLIVYSRDLIQDSFSKVTFRFPSKGGSFKFIQVGEKRVSWKGMVQLNGKKVFVQLFKKVMMWFKNEKKDTPLGALWISEPNAAVDSKVVDMQLHDLQMNLKFENSTQALDYSSCLLR